VARNDGCAKKRQVAVDDMQIGATYTAGVDTQQQLSRLRSGQRSLLGDQLRARPMQSHAFGGWRAHTSS
jgi:hypothetical protein